MHHDLPRNLGYAYNERVWLARFEHVLMFPGDNEGTGEQLDAGDVARRQRGHRHQLDLERGGARLASAAGLAVVRGRGEHALRALLRYYNGTALHRTALNRSVAIHTDSFAYQAEALVKLLRRGHSYVEVATPTAPRAGGRTKAFRLRNAIDVGRAICRLVVDVRR